MKRKDRSSFLPNFFSDEEYSDFIEDFEGKWLQYATKEEKMKAFFGNKENAFRQYILWLSGKEPFSERRNKLFK